MEEFAAEVSSYTSIYNTLSGDRATTFTPEELAFNGIYNDVHGNGSDYENSRNFHKNELVNKLSSDRSKKLDHPSKEFILSGGLRRKSVPLIPFAGQGHVLGKRPDSNQQQQVIGFIPPHQQQQQLINDLPTEYIQAGHIVFDN